jgi:hypothetical protein
MPKFFSATLGLIAVLWCQGAAAQDTYFAELDGNNVVTQVIIVDSANAPDEASGIAFCQYLMGRGTTWLQTSDDPVFRKNRANPGDTYDAVHDAFIARKPFPSWVLDTNYRWQPPVPRPTDGKMYYWDEATVSWVTN